MADDERDTSHEVKKFPAQHSSENIAAQKRMALSLVAQMMADPREMKSVLQYMRELVEWQERSNSGSGDGDGSGQES